ncbi:MAG: alpha/beta hydrolase fold protein [Chitinophagaceae bacterium]|nr:alpha/beta hydrolase fold protein [Chitinophagaceae bacterium]
MIRYSDYKKSVIAIHVFGNGDTTVVCLHGYGESGESFAFLEKYAGNNFTFIAPDLPFHGLTKWNEGNSFTLADLTSILSSFIPLSLKKISVAGYSMGGRLAFYWMQEQPGQFRSAVLLAPDGLHKSFWYNFSTQSKKGKRLFRFTMSNPQWLFGLIKIATGFRLLNKSVAKFAHHYLKNPAERELLYSRWTTFSNFKIDRIKLGKSIKKQKLKTTLITGRFDRIITSPFIISFSESDKKNITRIVVEDGHQLLNDKQAQIIISQL